MQIRDVKVYPSVLCCSLIKSSLERPGDFDFLWSSPSHLKLYQPHLLRTKHKFSPSVRNVKHTTPVVENADTYVRDTPSSPLQMQVFDFLISEISPRDNSWSPFLIFFFIFLYFIFYLYNIVLVLPYINMNPPQVYTCSPYWTL